MCSFCRTGGSHVVPQTEGFGMMVVGKDRNGLH